MKITPASFKGMDKDFTHSLSVQFLIGNRTLYLLTKCLSVPAQVRILVFVAEILFNC